MQPFDAKTLELVRGSTGLEGSSAQELCTSSFHGLGGCEELVPALDGTRTGNDDGRAILPTNSDTPGRITDMDAAAPCLESGANQFVGGSDLDSALDGRMLSKFNALSGIELAFVKCNHLVFIDDC